MDTTFNESITWNNNKYWIRSCAIFTSFLFYKKHSICHCNIVERKILDCFFICSITALFSDNLRLLFVWLILILSIARSIRPEVFCKKGVLRNFAIFTGKHLCQSLFFNKVKKETLTQLFFFEFWEISKNTFLYRTSPVAALIALKA